MTPSSRPLLRRLAGVAAGAAVMAVVLSGCLYEKIPADGGTTSPSQTGGPGSSEGAEPVTEGVPDELLPFYDQRLSWEECGQMQCTTVTAPLDWHDPSAGEIELSMIRQPALSGEAQGSLLTNPGGPGGSGVEIVRDSVDYIFGEPLQQGYDVVGWDPRGVGESTAVSCFDATEMDAYLYDIPENERGSAEWEAELDERAQEFAGACEANSDGILEYITTEQSARDLDLLRAVLGETELDYIGFSYGTFLGATYAGLFPERTGRLVLDGAIDPATASVEVGTTQAIGFEGALRSYMQACLDGETYEDCPFTGTVDDAMNDLGALLASLDANPLRASDGRMLGADSMLTGIIAALYAEGSWPALTTALATALEGDADTAFYLADFYNGRENGVYLDNSTEAFTAYNCMDYPTETDAEIEQTESIVAEKAPTIAPYWTGGASPCDYWPSEPTGTRGEINAPGAAPILVVGTTGDPATPYEWAESLADQLESGTLLTYEGEGHTAYSSAGSPCIADAVEAFLLEGTAPENGTTCS